MRLTLYSTDSSLEKICREALADSTGKHWRLCVYAPDSRLPQGDVCVWDVEDIQNLERLGPLSEGRFHVAVASEGRPIDAEIHSNVPLSAVLYRPFDTSRVKDVVANAILDIENGAYQPDGEPVDLCARVAHDLRTPLNSVAGYCQLLIEGALGPLLPGQIDVLRRVHRTAARANRLTSTLLRSAQPFPHSPESYGDIGETIGDAISDVQPMFARKSIAIEAVVDCADISVHFEPDEIVRVLVNLLENACRFTPVGGKIQIIAKPFFFDGRAGHHRARQSGVPNCVRIEVHDSGPGLEAPRNRSFQHSPFERLGLSIARSIVERHGGKLSAESSAAGAVFWFVLPMSPATEPAVSPSPSTDSQPCAGLYV